MGFGKSEGPNDVWGNKFRGGRETTPHYKNGGGRKRARGKKRNAKPRPEQKNAPIVKY